MAVTWLAALMLLLAGCGGTAKHPPVVAAGPPPPPEPGAFATTRDFIDLLPGWRLQIVAPVTKSGAYIVKTEPAPPSEQRQEQGNVITLKASADLIGYETASWRLTARGAEGGVSIKRASAELTRDGKTAPIPTPSRALIHVPKYARFLRIFYLTRKSASDHDMAILGTGRAEQLGPLTELLRASPLDACADRPRERIYCEWVPVGMAVRPELQKVVEGELRWVNPF